MRIKDFILFCETTLILIIYVLSVCGRSDEQAKGLLSIKPYLTISSNHKPMKPSLNDSSHSIPSQPPLNNSRYNKQISYAIIIVIIIIT